MTVPVAGVSIPTPGPRRPASQRAERLISIWLFLIPIGAAVLVPRLPLSLAVGDFLLAPLTVHGLWSMSRRGSPATNALRRAAPWMYVVLVGSLAGLIGVGLAGWALVDLAKNTMAVLSFFAVWHVLSTQARTRSMLLGFMSGAMITTILFVADDRPRPAAAFYHANYAAHYLACVALLVVASPGTRRTTRVVVSLSSLAGILATASFGGLAMVLVGGAFLFIKAPGEPRPLSWRRAPRWTRFVLLGLAGAFVVLAIPMFLSQRIGSEALTEARFNRSATTRADLYEDALGLFVDHPTGVGPTGVFNRALLVRDGVPWESHSDPLGYLLERGIVGLVGLVGFSLVVYRFARPFTMSRALFFMLLASALLRETLNYRHLWLALALSIATDSHRSAMERARRDAIGDESRSADEHNVPSLGPAGGLGVFTPGGRRGFHCGA